MNSAQRRRLLRISERRVRTGLALTRSEMEFVEALRLSARLQLSLAEDLRLHIDTGEEVSKIASAERIQSE